MKTKILGIGIQADKSELLLLNHENCLMLKHLELSKRFNDMNKQETQNCKKRIAKNQDRILNLLGA